MNSEPMTPALLLNLQQQAGNRAVLKLLRAARKPVATPVEKPTPSASPAVGIAAQTFEPPAEVAPPVEEIGSAQAVKEAESEDPEQTPATRKKAWWKRFW